MHSSFPCRMFLFDLDGTLIDSRDDIGRAVNATLTRLDRSLLPMPVVLRLVGDGVELLMRRALHEVDGQEPDQDLTNTAVRLLMEEYRNHLVESTSLYAGVRETLDTLRHVHTGVITNKPEDLARRVLAEFGLAGHFHVVLGGDSLPRRKPDPAQLLEALARCSVSPTETVMVGDSPTDVVAGKAAGVHTCGFSGGFRTRDEIQAAGPDVIVDRFADLLRYFRPEIDSGAM